MATNEVVGIDIVARLDGFRAELAKIPDIGSKEAKALTSQLSREIKKSERASKQAAAQSKKTAAAIRKQGEAARKAARSTTTLRGSLVKVAGVAAGAVITVEALKQAFNAVRSAVSEVVEGQSEVERFSTQWKEFRDSVLHPLAATITGIAGATATMMEAIGDTGAVDRFKAAVNSAFNEVGLAAVAGFGASIADIVARIEITTLAAQKMFAIAKLVKTSLTFDTEGNAEATADFHRLTEEIDAATAGFIGIKDAAGEWVEEARRGAGAALESFGKVGTAAEDATRVVIDAEQRQAAGIISAREAAKKAYIDSANARQKDADAAIRDAQRVAEAQKRALEESRAARMEAAEEQRQLQSSLAQSAISTAMDVADSVIDALKKTAMANVEGARERRDVELGLAILRGELQAAAAFGSTLATQGGTPAGFALAAAAAAAVGVSSKAAAAAGHAASSEKFHRGGVQADEGSKILRAGEGVLTPPAVRQIGGEQGLRSLNAQAGGVDGGDRTLMIGHRAFDAMVGQALARRGSVLTQSLQSLQGRSGSWRPHG